MEVLSLLGTDARYFGFSVLLKVNVLQNTNYHSLKNSTTYKIPKFGVELAFFGILSLLKGKALQSILKHFEGLSKLSEGLLKHLDAFLSI